MSFNRTLGNLGKAIDSASAGTFLQRDDATDVDFVNIEYSDLSGTPTALDSAAATNLIDSAYIQLRQGDLGGGGLDSAAATVLADSSYVAARTTNLSSGFFMYDYVATAGQTTFQDSDANGNVLSYGAGGVLVFYNGILMRRGSSYDYTEQNSEAIILTNAADSAANVTIAKWTATGNIYDGLTFQGDRGHLAGGYAEVNTQNADYFDITTPGNATTFGLLTVKRGPLCGFGDGTYAVYAGGTNDINTSRNTIDYFTIASIADAVDFGDLIDARGWFGGTSDGTYGLMAGGKDWSAGSVNAIEYVTIASPSNASDFGDLTVARQGNTGHCDGTYAIFGGGTNVIDYVTAATPSNATDFGDLTSSRADMGGSGANDATYAVYSGGGGVNTMDYITMATPSNATDFGDQSVQRNGAAGVSNGTYGVFCGGGNGNVMDYVTITVPANAVDFGDMANGGYYKSGCSGAPS